jgi:hypothetical protein
LEEAKSIQVAEESREMDWKSKSFMGSMFMGDLDINLAYPFPEQTKDDREEGDFVITKFEAWAKDHLDGDAIDKAQVIPPHVWKGLADLGLFGIKITGSGSHSADLLKVCIDQLNGLRQPINETELIRAKNTLKMNFMLAMEGSGDRLEEVARNYQTHGSLTLWKHCEAIDAVTSHQINAAATAALAGKPTMVVTGGSINMVPSMTDVQRQLH